MESYYRHLLAAHPHFWAPFIVLGQNVPLRSLAPEPREPPEK